MGSDGMLDWEEKAAFAEGYWRETMRAFLDGIANGRRPEVWDGRLSGVSGRLAVDVGSGVVPYDTLYDFLRMTEDAEAAFRKGGAA